MTSRHSSYWYFLFSKQLIFLYYLGFQVMAILCCAAKNSLRGTATIFVSRNGIPSWFLFCWNGLEQNSKCLLLFCSTERNSELFSLPRNFLFHGTARIPLEQTNCSVYSVFRGINFLVGNCQPHCWGIREVAREGKYFLIYEGRAMKGEIWVERDKGRVEGGRP